MPLESEVEPRHRRPLPSRSRNRSPAGDIEGSAKVQDSSTSKKISRKSGALSSKNESQKVLNRTLVNEGSEDLTDSDFEPKCSQRLKPRLQKKRRSKESAGGTSSKDMNEAGPSNPIVSKVKTECSSSGRSTPKPHWVLLDSHAEDIGGIAGVLNEQAASFKKRYLEHSWEEDMLPLAVKELQRYIKRAVQALCDVTEDLRSLSSGSLTVLHPVKTENSEAEDVTLKEENNFNGLKMKQEPAGAAKQSKSVPVDSSAECSPVALTRTQRCGSTDSDCGISTEIPTNNQRCGSAESVDIASAGQYDSDNQEAQSEPEELNGVNADAADIIPNSSCDMFSDNDFPDLSDHKDSETFPSGTNNGTPTEIPQSTKSLDCKANLMADSSSDTESDRAAVESSNNIAAASDCDSDDEAVSPQTSQRRRVKSTFNIKNLDVYHSDTKLQEKCFVSIAKTHEAEELAGRYQTESNSEDSDDDRSVKNLTNLKSLKRKGKGSGNESENSAESSEKGQKKKKAVKEKKEEKLADFMHQVSDGSDGEHSFENVSAMCNKAPEENMNDVHKKLLLESSDSDNDLADGAGELSKVDEKCEEAEESSLPASDTVETEAACDDVKSDNVESENSKSDDCKPDDTKSGVDKSGGDKSGGDNSGGDKSGGDKSGGDKSSDAEDGGAEADDAKADDAKADDGNADSNESDDEGNSDEKKKWRKDRLLTAKLSDTDTSEDEKRYEKRKLKAKVEFKSSDEEIVQPKKRKKKETPKKKDSDIEVISDDPQSSSSEDFVKKKTKKTSKKSSSSSESEEEKPKKKRRRIKKVQNSSSEDDEAAKDKDKDSPLKGRKKIKHIIGEEDLEKGTKEAAKEEEERLKRIASRQKMYDELYENVQKGFSVLDKLVLDFDEKTKEPLVEVDKTLVKKLKPHQVKGVKFMWDACFESLKRIKSSTGSGCILAHCMGLGKTFQVVTLVHTLFKFPATKVERVLVVCPVSTVLNWVNEFHKWLDSLRNGPDIEVFEMTRCKQNIERSYKLREWMESGGVMVIGYDMYRNITNPQSKRVRANMMRTFQQALVDPGPDLVICDEGHLLKNEDTGTSKAMTRIRTLRRVILTGTPLQNNLKEYHCMVQFVKPNLLGTRKEFLNRFVNPITNGQFEDSTSHDVKKMKRRAHVLHKTLEGCVQRFDYSVLTPYLPAKEEYVISVRISDTQEKLYRYYLDNISSRGQQGKGAQIFADFQQLQRIWTHPRVLKMSQERNDLKAEKEDESDSEGSLVDFIDDGSGDDTTPSPSSSSSEDDDDVVCLSDGETKKKKKAPPPARRTRSKKDASPEPEPIEPDQPVKGGEWWQAFVKDSDFEDLRESPKLQLLFSILKDCEENGEKLLVFSQSLFSLDIIEYFLGRIDDASQRNEDDETLDGHKGSWSLGMDYFRLDGSTPTELRSTWCGIFNKTSNHRARLFLISTRAGGLGINLVAANRVVIFDASWNPSHDVQSIFRVYRFGQTKPCFIYRFLAQGTMEEKIYERQVTKLSLACRVVDELQVERYYKMADLAELYQFTPADRTSFEVPKLPKDHLFAELLKKFKRIITTYHEHDSLLENKEEEELNEDERKAAWEDYENEKKGPVVQQFPMSVDIPSLEQLKETMRLREPEKTDQELEEMAATAYRQIILYQEQQQRQYLQRLHSQQQMQAQQQKQQQQLQQQQMNYLKMQQQLAQRMQLQNLQPQQQNFQFQQQNFPLQQQNFPFQQQNFPLQQQNFPLQQQFQPFQYPQLQQQPFANASHYAAHLPSTSMASHSRPGFAQQQQPGILKNQQHMPGNPQQK